MSSTATTTERDLTPAGKRILDTASRLFYEHGIRAVGVDMIAREANVTKKTIYDRFGSKDELIRTYLQRGDQQWHSLISEQVERPGSTPRERILAMFEIMRDEVRTRGCSFINAYAEFSEVDHPAFEVARGQKVWTREYFTRLAREAGVSDPETLGSQLALLHEGVYIAFAMAGDEDAAEHARSAADVLLTAALEKGH